MARRGDGMPKSLAKNGPEGSREEQDIDEVTPQSLSFRPNGSLTRALSCQPRSSYSTRVKVRASHSDETLEKETVYGEWPVHPSQACLTLNIDSDTSEEETEIHVHTNKSDDIFQRRPLKKQVSETAHNKVRETEDNDALSDSELPLAPPGKLGIQPIPTLTLPQDLLDERDKANRKSRKEKKYSDNSSEEEEIAGTATRSETNDTEVTERTLSCSTTLGFEEKMFDEMFDKCPQTFSAAKTNPGVEDGQKSSDSKYKDHTNSSKRHFNGNHHPTESPMKSHHILESIVEDDGSDVRLTSDPQGHEDSSLGRRGSDVTSAAYAQIDSIRAKLRSLASAPKISTDQSVQKSVDRSYVSSSTPALTSPEAEVTSGVAQSNSRRKSLYPDPGISHLVCDAINTRLDCHQRHLRNEIDSRATFTDQMTRHILQIKKELIDTKDQHESQEKSFQDAERKTQECVRNMNNDLIRTQNETCTLLKDLSKILDNSLKNGEKRNSKNSEMELSKLLNDHKELKANFKWVTAKFKDSSEALKLKYNKSKQRCDHLQKKNSELRQQFLAGQKETQDLTSSLHLAKTDIDCFKWQLHESKRIRAENKEIDEGRNQKFIDIAEMKAQRCVGLETDLYKMNNNLQEINTEMKRVKTENEFERKQAEFVRKQTDKELQQLHKINGHLQNGIVQVKKEKSQLAAQNEELRKRLNQFETGLKKGTNSQGLQMK